MRIAFDMHGVLSLKEIFLPIIERLREEGHRIIVLSGMPVRLIKRKLETVIGYDLEIFDLFYSIIDYFCDNINRYNRLLVWKNLRGWWINDDYLWSISKSNIALEQLIDLLIDDMIIYKTEYLLDNFILYLGQDDIELVIFEKINNTYIKREI